MKKNLYYLFIFFIFNMFIFNVDAMIFNCTYLKDKNGITHSFNGFKLKIDTEKSKIKFEEIGTDYFGGTDHDVSFLEKTWFSTDNGATCQDVWLCYNKTTNQSGSQFTGGTVSYDVKLYIKEEDVKNDIKDYEMLKNLQQSTEDGKWYCVVMVKETDECDYYLEEKRDLEALYKQYGDCENFSCELENLKEIKQIQNNLKKHCRVILENLNYGEDCVKECLNIKTELETLDKQYNISTGVNSSQCGFSGKLIQWIANIVKWLKYIIPVLVIVLGILDFIKAIANEKEDEMKKAQGHFVKRLIAAALIFIVPFIIEFILDKMGYAANGCGIIDL